MIRRAVRSVVDMADAAAFSALVVVAATVIAAKVIAFAVREARR